MHGRRDLNDLDILLGFCAEVLILLMLFVAAVS
jgi:hypothetical protein